MTEIRVLIALSLFSLSVSWALQSAGPATDYMVQKSWESHRAESQRQVDEAVKSSGKNVNEAVQQKIDEENLLLTDPQ